MEKKKKKQLLWRYIFAGVIIILGIILASLQVGNDFLGFQNVGTWLVFIGFIMLVVITLQLISDKKRVVDERMISLSYKATRITFVLIIFAAFTIMIADGINPLGISYSMFMGYFVSFMLLVYFVSYKILERYY